MFVAGSMLPTIRDRSWLGTSPVPDASTGFLNGADSDPPANQPFLLPTRLAPESERLPKIESSSKDSARDFCGNDLELLKGCKVFLVMSRWPDSAHGANEQS